MAGAGATAAALSVVVASSPLEQAATTSTAARTARRFIRVSPKLGDQW
jgi:hypothetical protein